MAQGLECVWGRGGEGKWENALQEQARSLCEGAVGPSGCSGTAGKDQMHLAPGHWSPAEGWQALAPCPSAGQAGTLAWGTNGTQNGRELGKRKR